MFWSLHRLFLQRMGSLSGEHLRRSAHVKVGVALGLQYPRMGLRSPPTDSPNTDQYPEGTVDQRTTKEAQIITHHATLCLPYALSANG